MRFPARIGLIAPLATLLFLSACERPTSPSQPSDVLANASGSGGGGGGGGGANVTLTVQKNGTGSGTVTSNPSGINCGNTCARQFAQNTTVTLTATPAAGSVFAGWGGNFCAGTGLCTTTLSSSKFVTATFNLSGTPPPPPPNQSPPLALTLSHASLDQVGNLSIAGVNFDPNPPVPLSFSVQSSHPANAVVPATVNVTNFSDPGNPVAAFNVTYDAVVAAPTQVTISVSAAGVTRTALLTLLPPPPPTLAPGERGPGFVGSDFVTFATLGTVIALGPNGVGPLRVDLLSGKLPDGLRFKQPTCATPAKCPWVEIVGTPNRVQTSVFTARGTDSRGQQATGTFTIVINPARP